MFELINKLPASLDIMYRGRVYEDMRPALVARNGKLDLMYVGYGRALLLYERIEDQQELVEAIEWVCDYLNGVTVYKTDFFPRV